MRTSRSAAAAILLVAAAGLFVFALARHFSPKPVAPAHTAAPATAAPATAPVHAPPASMSEAPPQATQPAARPETQSPAMMAKRPPAAMKDHPAPPPLPKELLKGPPQPLPPNLPDPEELREQFELLQRFLELPPDRLARIRETIERIERLPESRKQMLLKLIHDSKTTPSTTSPSMDSPLADIPANVRPEFEPVWKSLTVPQRRKLIERLQPLSREQRIAFFQGIVAIQSLKQDQAGPAWTPPQSTPATSQPGSLLRTGEATDAPAAESTPER